MDFLPPKDFWTILWDAAGNIVYVLGVVGTHLLVRAAFGSDDLPVLSALILGASEITLFLIVLLDSCVLELWRQHDSLSLKQSN